MKKPLIAMIGISQYDKGVFEDLECVVNDYKNVQHAFYVKRGYSFVYCDKNNRVIHKKGLKINKIKNATRTVSSRNNTKLRWTDNEVLDYNDQIHSILENKKYNYDGLIYFISSHGDRDGVIYDSKGDKIPLIVIFDKFSNQHCIQLRNKPKIYFVDACRGNQRTKRFANSLLNSVIETEKKENVKTKIISTNKKVKFDENVISISKSSQNSSMEIGDDKASKASKYQALLQSTTTIEQTPSPAPPDPFPIHDHHLFNNETTIPENDDGKDDMKDEIKDAVIDVNYNLSSSNTSNVNVIFSKYNYNREIYANTEGYAVVEPGSKGAYMTRSITQAIENDDIFQKDLNTIVNHTRKIMLKLMGTSVECAAQVIQDNNNIPRKVFFG